MPAGLYKFYHTSVEIRGSMHKLFPRRSVKNKFPEKLTSCKKIFLHVHAKFLRLGDGGIFSVHFLFLQKVILIKNHGNVLFVA